MSKRQQWRISRIPHPVPRSVMMSEPFQPNLEQPELDDEQMPETWRPPRWQLMTEHGIFDYDRKPRNPFTRLAMFLRGYRWRRNPIFTSHQGRGF